MDYGKEGLCETLQVLGQQAIPFFGAGLEPERCNNPLLIKFDGLTIAVFGYVCASTHAVFASGAQPGVRLLDPSLIDREIALARQQGADRVVVLLHWGAEEVYQPKPVDVKTARHVIESGADLIIGHHSHCIQPWERWRGKHIFYGLGNAYFPHLDAPAFFDGAGKPACRFRKRQQAWNRLSLAVAWEPRSGSTMTQTLTWDRKGWTWNRLEAPPEGLRYRAGKSSLHTYNRSVAWSRLKGLFFSLLDQPRCPKPSTLFSLFKSLTRSRTETQL
jgi:poly-gamma-glutamate synthesis protein (capsule biosynthesis protein)